ncbi:MAG: MetQ/NlpA family ABC transporter substrate-binding protein [Coriobacteriia bacterium]|nr:MetQ/NlpA family ABC transporter substrate-binding protein [Coriobacteriia bacterium]
MTGCSGFGSSSDKTIKVAASPTPHAEILNNAVKSVLEKDGYTLEVTEFQDYVQPNTATENGDVDANYFQHGPYLDSFNKENGTHLVSVEPVHYEPFGLYSDKIKDLKDLADGSTVAVPNDTTNEARALLLLEQEGLIELDKDAGITATTKDITSNPKNLKFKELEAASVAKNYQDKTIALAAINSNYALEADLDPSKDALAIEDVNGTAAKTYANILVVKEGNEDTEKTKELKKALNSDEVRDYINNTYNGAVLPVF